jgi:chromosome segregation ATPase
VASSFEHPEPVSDLERVASLVEEELAGWRRRSLKAEGELEEARTKVPPAAAGDIAQLRDRVAALEVENQGLRLRIAQAREQIEQLKTRLRFVGDQVAGDLG